MKNRFEFILAIGTFTGGMIILFILMFATVRAMGFPEMVRHGYPNCVSCHFSPSGGGLLNAYGKVQSEELLATWKLGIEPKPAPLTLGSQLRVLQVQSDTKKAFRRAFVLMQADMEAAVTYDRFTVVGTMGSDGGKPFSRRHYVIGKINDAIHLRIGKLMPFFGLGLPDHNLAIRQGFEPGSERYAIETGVIYESGNTFATYSRGEGIVRQTFNVGEGAQIGGSIRSAEAFSGGLHVIWGAPDYFSVMGEGVLENGRVEAFAQLGVTPYRGVTAFARQGFGRRGFTGLGLEWIPVSGFQGRAEIDFTSEGYTGILMGYFWL